MAHRKDVRGRTVLYLQKYRFATSEKIAKSLGCSEKTVNEAFRQLKKDEKIYIIAWSFPLSGIGELRRVMALKQYPYQVDQSKPRAKSGVQRTTKYRQTKKAREAANPPT